MTVRGMRLLEVESRRKGGASREIDINFGRGEKLGEETSCYV